MDFELSDEQTAIRDLAAQILGDKLGHQRLKELEASSAFFADDVWAELAKADLVGIALPELDGGGGYSILEACLVLTELGRTTAPVPYLATVVGGALPIARFGSDALRARVLPGVIAGTTILTAALTEAGSTQPPAAPATVATAVGDGWALAGAKTFVAAAHLATGVLVPARTPDGSTTVFLVDPSASGVALERNETTNRDPWFTITFDGVAVGADDVVGEVGGGAAVVEFTRQHLVAGLCALQAGVCAAAVAMTATYTSQRQQFGTPIATFQAVAHRAADAYIDANGVQFTAWQAAWRLAEGLDAEAELAIAKFWAAEGAQRVVHACQHLHGGIGVDTDYPLHRTFRWAKVLELSLGGGTEHLLRLGDLLAAS